MSDINWDAIPEVAVPQGTFVGWARVGQAITGIVRGYSTDGGSDYNDAPCPLLTVELTAPGESYHDKGTTRETLAVGELASITAGQAGLRRRLLAAEPKVGDAIRIVYSGTYATGKGEGKDYEVRVVHGAGLDHVAAAPIPSRTAPVLSDEEPF